MNPADPVVFILIAAATVLALALVREVRRRRAAEAAVLDERARLEASLMRARRESAAEMGSLLDQMIEALIAIDGNRNVRLANPAAARLFGFPLPAAGRSLLELVRHHEMAAVLARLAGEGSVRDHEFVIEGEKPRTVRVNAVALPGGAGALLVFRDETQLRRLESNRRDFVANVSHELRTPLSMIKGSVENLQDGAISDPAATTRFLEIIERHAGRLGLLIEDLLLLSSLDSGRIELRLTDVPLRDTVSETVDDLAGAAAERGVTVSNSVPADMRVRADPLRLKQILSNLVENAIRHGREGGAVGISASPVTAGWLRVAIQDDGPGVPEAIRDRIFERFFRADKARSRNQGGTGLGLSIVKNLVLAHEGRVRVDSAPGGGSIFSFTMRYSGGRQNTEE